MSYSHAEGRIEGRVRYGAANHRYAPVGTVRICKPTRTRRRPHVRIKVSDRGPAEARWRYLAVVVWEAAHGPVPHGMRLWHVNGDSLDCRLENLELVTAAESLRRNIQANLPACREAWARQARKIGRQNWQNALAARRIKAARRERCSANAT
jgi:hypothetical protein